MQVYVVSSGARIAPFGDPIAELPVGGVPMREWQGSLFRKFGLEPVSVEGLDQIPSDQARLVTYDNVFFSRRVLKSFLSLWKASGQSAAQLALPKDSTFVRRFSDLQERELTEEHALFHLWGLPAGSSSSDAKPLEVVYKEKLLTVPVPRHVVGFDAWVHPLTSSVCMHLTHWLHLLQANLLSVQVRWVDWIVSHPVQTVLRLLVALPGRPTGYQWRVLRRFNQIGRNVDIHPTALVEGSILGDGVVVGPQATVRGSIVGAGSVIDQRADVTFSVLGDGCFVSKHSIIYATSAMDHADLCLKGMQMCLAGREAGLSARVHPMDTVPGGKIKVEVEGRLEEIDLEALGSCFGHNTWIGPEIYIAPGRAIPNGTRIGAPPDRTLIRIPDSLDTSVVHRVVNGTLEPLG